MENKFKLLKQCSGLVKALFCSSLLLVAVSGHTQETNKQEKGAEALYQEHCQSCHGVDRMGSMGPALFPENLSRLRKNKAIEVIQQGRVATQMPAFAQQLNVQQTQLLVDYIYTKPTTQPQWTMADIQASNVQHFDQNKLGDKPLFDADLMNLFIVVELGDHSATLLNGDTFEPITRFKTRFAFLVALEAAL